MTFEQGLSFAIVGTAVALFASGRFRYDAISLGALLVAVLTGVVDGKHAFTGFTSDVVIVIAGALILSAAITRSGVIEPLVAPLIRHLRTPQTQVPAMAAATGLFAMINKNVGALAALMPVAIRLGRSEQSSPSLLLMPMSFMALLGGLVTLVGTSTNIIVSQVREDTFGKPFAMFDFAPVGLGLTLAGFVFLSFGWRLLPRDRAPRAAMEDAHAGVQYATEAGIGDGWPESLATVADLKLGDFNVQLTGLIDAQGERRPVDPGTKLVPGMVLQIRGEEESLATLFQRLPLEHAREEIPVETEEANEELRSIEAVVEPRSILVGLSAGIVALQRTFGTKLLAVSRHGQPLRERLSEVRFEPGDLVVIQAGEGALARVLQELGLLPLAERSVTIGTRRARYGPILLLSAAIALVALHVLPVAVGFFAAAVAVIAIGSLSMREAYRALEPEVLVLIGALTPLSEAIHDNGGTALIAHGLASALSGASPIIVLGGMMLAAMVCAPFLHNAPTVLILAPIGVGLAEKLGLGADAMLMAVATGAGCDFLTPIGHQCNTLVRGPGGYRFGDYARLGLPLSFIVILLGTPLVAWVWGLRPG
uniref:SLC13 family permease n=1 Tax=Altererythrobacter segetis TaxID=1104773 RepID=UPI00140E59D1|nr:SLC13 family permease [Altererythrobacter segetis]